MGMQDLKKLETLVLQTMVAAHSSYYGRKLTVGETTDCNTTIGWLQDEIASRKNAEVKMVPGPF
jgi:hypothetical protein